MVSCGEHRTIMLWLSLFLLYCSVLVHTVTSFSLLKTTTTTTRAGQASVNKRTHHDASSFVSVLHQSTAPTAEAETSSSSPQSSTTASSSSSTADSNNKKIKNKKRKTETTLYDVLGISPEASRSDLKRQYMTLAKQTHPDALIGRNLTADEVETNMQDFVEIAEAYRVLSSPKLRRKYDRSLQAEDFVESVEQAASQFTKSAAPQVKKVLQDFALPLFRRTTATTFASITAVAQDIRAQTSVESNETRIDLGSAVNSAIAAGQRAGQLLDRLELIENSKSLRDLAVKEMEKVQDVEEELWNVTGKRLSLLLRVDDVPLSSHDATELLDHLAATMPESDGVKLKNSVATEISSLRNIETDYKNKLEVFEQAEAGLVMSQQELELAQRGADKAMAEEKAAHKAWQQAQKRLAQYKEASVNWAKEHASRQFLERRASSDLQRVGTTLSKRQERVRKLLLRKEAFTDCKQVTEEEEEDMNIAKQHWRELVQEEDDLMEQQHRLQNAAVELSNRAASLETKADDVAETNGQVQPPPPPSPEEANGQVQPPAETATDP